MKCAVLGDPVAHSLSPALHRAAYEALGLAWTYDAVRVPAGTLAAFLDALDDSWRGLSLTMPLKREVVPLLTSSDDWSQVTGAANTVLLDGRGGRHGMNTDVPGAKAALSEHTSGTFTRAVVLGGGATAASVIFALAELGLAHATILARDPDRTTETLRVLATGPTAVAVDVLPLADAVTAAQRADVVVSTIPVSAQVPRLVAAMAEVPVVFDVIYHPWPTPLAAAAEASGRTLVSGLDLLLAQAGGQVEAMTHADDVPLDVMRAAAERVLAHQDSAGGVG